MVTFWALWKVGVHSQGSRGSLTGLWNVPAKLFQVGQTHLSAERFVAGLRRQTKRPRQDIAPVARLTFIFSIQMAYR